MDTWLSEYAVLDIVESIKQLESLGGGNILSIYMYTFSGACNLYRDRKMSVNRWVAIGRKTLLRTKLRGPWLLTDSLLGFRLQTKGRDFLSLSRNHWIVQNPLVRRNSSKRTD